MSEILDVHLATHEERTEAFRNVHDVWGGGLSLEEHVRRRLANPKYDNATWYVGTLGDRVVTSCGCYHQHVRLDGTIEPTSAVGAVHTLAEFRGRGFAPQLLAFAERDQRAAGKTFSLLYSDISPSYYERLGYRLCAAAQGWVRPAESKALATGGLVRFEPSDMLPALVDLYDRGHARQPLSIARSADYWRYLLAQDSQDEFYFGEVNGRRVGYVRLAIKPPNAVLRDLLLVEDTDEARRGLLTALIAWGRERGMERVSGWMPADAISGELFHVSDRTRELTMIKPLVERIRIDDRHLDAAQHFHEIDHV